MPLSSPFNAANIDLSTSLYIEAQLLVSSLHSSVRLLILTEGAQPIGPSPGNTNLRAP